MFYLTALLSCKEVSFCLVLFFVSSNKSAQHIRSRKLHCLSLFYFWPVSPTIVVCFCFLKPLSTDAHLCRAKCLLAMVSAATSRRSKASKKDAHVQQSVSAALPKINAKRKRDGSSGNDVGQTRAASAAGAGFSALITGRVAIEIKAALTDALDAFHAVRNVSCMRETLYLQANFFHATARPDMRDHASAAFL